MKKMTSIYSTMLICLNLFAQGKWDYQNPYPNGSEIRNIFAISPESAVGIDLSGHAVKTENNLDWENVENQSTINAEIYRAHFIDMNTGWMAGFDPMNGRGFVFKTVDGGKNWEEYVLPSNILICTYFLDAHTGWAAGGGGQVIRTEDGGKNWTKQNCSGVQYLLDIYFVNANVGYAVGTGGRIYKTINGGANWLSKNGGINNWLWSVNFIDENIGYATGENSTILKTIDGGDNWITLYSGAENLFFSSSFLSADTGFVVGGGGLVMKTYDGGNNWEIKETAMLWIL